MKLRVADIQTVKHLIQHSLMQFFAPDQLLRKRYQSFREILRLDNEALDLLTELESHLTGEDPADHFRIIHLCQKAMVTVGSMASHLHTMNPSGYGALPERYSQLSSSITVILPKESQNTSPPYVLPLIQAADFPELCGGKAANLSAAGRTGVTIPQGFVITAHAFHRLVNENHLQEPFIERFRQVHTEDHQTIIRITGELQELILRSTVPADIVTQIQKMVIDLRPEGLLAVRSSALAEDGRISFAGQYASELEVEPDDIISAYKRVIAGKYCPRAVAYRLRHGLSDTDTTMAALVIPMIAPRTSGVIYTRDPAPLASEESLGIYAVRGLAEGLVDGSQTPEKYHLPRNSTDITLESAGVSDILLNVSELQQLRQWGLGLERFFGSPQDIEWALDDNGITILQSRPLHQKKDPPPALVQAVDLETLLYMDLHCAAPGIACGPVFHAPTGKCYVDIPQGAVVVTPTLRPSLSQFLDRIAGVIAKNGSRASHFASVARERGIPVLVGDDVVLDSGEVVTVDAASGRIFRGCVNSVLQTGKKTAGSEFPVEQYKQLAACTIRLGLTDPDGTKFIPEQCCSLHDIVRFCHEKSVREMFTLLGRKGRGLGKAKKLETDLPLTMYVLDLDPDAKASKNNVIALENIRSLPMQALWQGMSDKRIHWDADQHHIDWQDFDQMSGGIFALDSQLLASYAIVAKEYLHLNIRFGYHFSIVDTICGEKDSTNYVNFRFKGGGAALQQRLFRLEFIEQVLTAFGFETICKGDMLDANFSRSSQPATELALKRLGLLLAATRRMDVRMTGSQQAAEESKKFIALANSYS